MLLSNDFDLIVFPEMNEAQAEHILNSGESRNATNMLLNQKIKFATLWPFPISVYPISQIPLFLNFSIQLTFNQ